MTGDAVAAGFRPMEIGNLSSNCMTKDFFTLW